MVRKTSIMVFYMLRFASIIALVRNLTNNGAIESDLINATFNEYNSSLPAYTIFPPIDLFNRSFQFESIDAASTEIPENIETLNKSVESTPYHMKTTFPIPDMEDSGKYLTSDVSGIRNSSKENLIEELSTDSTEATKSKTTENKPSKESIEEKFRLKIPYKRRRITSIFSDNSTILNPYPYGPRHLPANTYSKNINSVESSSVSIIPPDFPPEDEFFDYEKEKNKLVHTEKPTILFHFEIPGYKPKVPEAAIPPMRAATPSDPWDCSPRCPQYKLLDWNPDYDIREYPATTWISTVIISKTRVLAELEGYMRVQDYFYGLNDRGHVMNLTIPFITQIKHSRHPSVLKETSEYALSLYINHEEDPYDFSLPTPISNEVLVDRLKKKTVFVSGFEANVWEVTDEFLKDKASKMMKKLQQNGEAYLSRYYYLASYTRPELYQPVYYELWVYATKFRNSANVSLPLLPRRKTIPNKITIKTSAKLCRGVECPPFDVLRTYRYGIQKRRYYDGMFATTTLGECQFSTVSVWKGFMPLHLYKHGINSHMEVLEATRPIAMVHVQENFYSHCPQNMTMAIYLPKRLHGNPPLTGYAAPSVSVTSFTSLVVYSYTVGGYLLEPTRVRKELSDMKHRLTEFGACFKDTEYYVVVYDFIVRYHGRQNEIWIVAENCRATQNG